MDGEYTFVGEYNSHPYYKNDDKSLYIYYEQKWKLYQSLGGIKYYLECDDAIESVIECDGHWIGINSSFSFERCSSTYGSNENFFDKYLMVHAIWVSIFIFMLAVVFLVWYYFCRTPKIRFHEIGDREESISKSCDTDHVRRLNNREIAMEIVGNDLDTDMDDVLEVNPNVDEFTAGYDEDRDEYGGDSDEVELKKYGNGGVQHKNIGISPHLELGDLSN